MLRWCAWRAERRWRGCWPAARPRPLHGIRSLRAWHRYKEPLWLTLNWLDTEQTLARQFMVSALHGLLVAGAPVENYDLKLTPMGPAHQVEPRVVGDVPVRRCRRQPQSLGFRTFPAGPPRRARLPRRAARMPMPGMLHGTP